VFRITTSNVSDLSVFVAKSGQSMHPFPLPPLKFRTVSFPSTASNEHPRATFIRSTRTYKHVPSSSVVHPLCLSG
jgi:hypothetical protein